ncbi:hypothetical protein FRC01_008364 [Tulasnella sp. 417]|nr:hypothetical protein FRC01_008364 [Tulasnella sp. 417]
MSETSNKGLGSFGKDPGNAVVAVSSSALPVREKDALRETEPSQEGRNDGISSSTGAGPSIIPSERNSRLPIHQLPIEVLVVVFELVLLDHEPFQGLMKIPLSSLLRTLRLVSVYWHQVIDQAPALWAITSCNDPEWAVRRALQKSKESLLSVFCGCTYIYTKRCDYATLVAPHSSRWWSLRVDSVGAEKFEPFLNVPVQNLRHISIGFYGYSHETQPDIMLPETAQKLRTVDVRNISFSLGEAISTNIQVLRLRNSRGQNLSVDLVLRALAASAKSLRDLDIRKCVIRPGNSSFTTIRLPHLREFAFHYCTPESMAQILNAIDYPDEVKLDVMMDCDIGAGSGVVGHFGERIRRAVAKNSRLPLSIIFAEYKVLVFALETLRLGFFVRGDDYDATIDGMEPELETLRVAMEKYLGPSLKDNSLWMKLELVPAADPPEPIEELGGLERALNICHSSFPKAPGLIILGDQIAELLQHLARPLNDDGNQSWLFPEMESLWIEGRKFDASLPKCIELIQGRRAASSAKSIRELKVACTDCSINDVISSPLRHSVPNLIATTSPFSRR